MKVIGIQDETRSGRAYIAIISHSEVNAVFDKAYGHEIEFLQVGQSVNLADGARFRNQIKTTCESMARALENFKSSAATMAEFTKLVASLPGDSEPEKPAAQAAE